MKKRKTPLIEREAKALKKWCKEKGYKLCDARKQIEFITKELPKLNLSQVMKNNFNYNIQILVDKGAVNSAPERRVIK